MYKIVETDNHDSDFPDENFTNVPPMTKVAAQEIADILNKQFGQGNRYYKVEAYGYKLIPGFEP